MTKIEQLQKISCLLLDEFVRVCRQHNLSWFIDAGSLLGVIRHSGFIPWDDDVDVVMPRYDYNLLYEYGKQWFEYPFYLDTSSNNDSDTLTIKLRYSMSTLLFPHKIAYGKRTDGTFIFNCGIGLDIVPLDYVPEDKNKRQLLHETIRFIYDTVDTCGVIAKNDSQKLLLLSKYTKGAKLYTTIMTEISAQPTSRMACTSWWQFPNSYKYTVSAACYEDYIEKYFEGCSEKVRVPVGYDEILTAYYGDYMTPKPPPSGVPVCSSLVDSEHSFREYEKFSNDELLDMMQNNKTL